MRRSRNKHVSAVLRMARAGLLPVRLEGVDYAKKEMQFMRRGSGQ